MRTYIAEALLARIRGGFHCKVHLLRSDCLLNKQYVKKMTYLIAIFTNAIMIRSFLPDKSHFPSQGFLSGSENLVFGRWIYLVLFLLKALLYNFALFVSLYLYILSYSHTKFVLTSTFKSIFNVNIIYCYGKTKTAWHYDNKTT